MRSRTLALAFGTLALVACDRPADPTPDGGPPVDVGPVDPIAPTVLDTTPADGETGVLREAELIVRFSEPMSPEVGTVTVAPGGASLLASAGEWSDARNVLTLRPTTPWPAGEVTLTFGSDFTDRAGNPLAEHVVVFETIDDVSPTVVETTPAEGATAISARIGEIVIRFDEPMRTTAGTLDVLGGAATVGEATWSEGASVVTFVVSDLEYEREYDVTLRGFLDANGNRLVAGDYLGDMVLDFSTGADADGPRVLRSEPAEGQLDVDPADTSAILVTFDEVMDTAVRDVTLSDGTTPVAITGTWTGSGRILRVETAGLLAFGTEYALDLRGLRDRAGNAIDEVTYLGDGHLDFTVGLDAFLPFVGASSPVEGEPDVSYTETTEISVSFSEAMDTSVTTVPLTAGGAPIDVDGTWTTDTELVLDVAGLLVAGATIAIDLRSMRDARGNALDAEHRYLGDGLLDFTTSAPIGEGCLDPLTTAQATETSPGVFEWTLSSLQGSVRDGGTATCDSNGTSANGADVLVRFDKTSGTVGSGGRYLRVVLDASTSSTGSNSFDLAVATGASCSPSTAPVRCHSNAGLHHVDLDLAAGPVWIWVSRTSSSSSSVAARVTVSEIDPPRIEGDSCDAPYTTASAIYTPPTAPGMVHRFSIPRNAQRSVDIGPYSYASPNLFTCDTAAGHGIDGVVRFDKPDAASVLRVSARRTEGLDSFNFEVFDACDVGGTSPASLGCRSAVSTTAQDFLVDAPAGPLYVWFGDTTTSVSRSGGDWLTSNAIELDIEVIPDVQAGEICSRAHAATVGANAVAGTSDQRFNPPSCFDAASNVEWYRVTTAHPVLFVGADAAGGLALLDPTTAGEIACVADGAARTLTRVLPVGTSVCVAVEMGRGITSIDVSGQAYGGLGSTPPVDLGILRPFNSTASAEESVTSDYWMAVNDSTLLMRHTFSAVMDVPRAGGERAARRGSDDGVTSSMLGRTGVVANGALFAFNTSTGSTTSRITRLWDGRSAVWSPITWDVSPSYVPQPIQAAAPDGASDILYVTDGATTTSRPTFYRIFALARSAPQLVGSSTRLSSVRGMVVDDQYVYVSALVDTIRGIYRVPRGDVGAEPFRLARSDRFSSSTTQATAMAIDAMVAPENLYVRNADGEVEAIIDPAGASPFYLGPVIERGRASDWAMTLDPATGQLYLFETETVANGTWLRYDP